ncbi:methyltransferase domain-containing protein [Desulfosoma caldarium]|uniref:methyltransferase domain-containing protein n=1 Tax=Desulfosoma caldarium TaxID=610254 RepID=UPI001472BCD0|nr:methyltransferase domain-containing protein [Desulfosoma caldarium]
MDQDEEWIYVEKNGRRLKLRLHDYGKLYKIPGLYEQIYYEKLKCNSHNVVCSLLGEALQETADDEDQLRVLDFGAGNGMVGEKVRDMGCDLLVGVDILPEAKEAAERDRPGVYDRYYVLNLADLEENIRARLEAYHFNTLVTVSALGFNDIPIKGFLNAFNLLEDGAWVAFNIRDRFLSDDDQSGYRQALESMIQNNFEIAKETPYCHRLSITGDELCYHAIVGRKTGDVDVESLVSQ